MDYAQLLRLSYALVIADLYTLSMGETAQDNMKKGNRHVHELTYWFEFVHFFYLS